MSGSLSVFLHGELVGRVSEGRDRACWFSYRPEYTERRNALPLSLSMPVEDARYDMLDWMESLLPNRLDARERWSKRYGLKSLLAMDMLATPIGWDCAGAVQFCAESTEAEMLSREPGSMALSEGELGAHLESVRRGVPGLPDAPPGAPFSLAGAQAKTVLSRSGEEWAIPTGGAPSTHILKVALPGYEDNDLVEHVCMGALRRCGVPAAPTEIVQAAGERAIAVKRYDRILDGAGEVARVHQEDLCQALGFPSMYKYQSNGGPSPADAAEALRGAVDGDAAVARFRDALICNWLLAAPDAHAKNYSLLISGSGYSLAPLYDVCSMAPYTGPSRDIADIALAMSVGDAWSVREAENHEAWRDCADDLGIDAGATLARAEELAEQIPRALAAAAGELPPEHGDNPRVADLVEGVQRLAEKRRDRLAESLSPGVRTAGIRYLSAERSGSRPARKRRRTRCPHVGRRTGRRCVRRYRHPGPHRY